MRVTYNWLKDFVDIKLSPKALADKLTMAGIEVSAIEEKHGDYVFEIEITSNRPDWLSVIGLAREVAAITNTKLKSSSLISRPSPLVKGSDELVIEVEDKKDCPLYTAKIIRGVKVEAAPDWMRKRLELVGLRSVNNIVDITNYVLFETGEPLHAFDIDNLVASCQSPVTSQGVKIIVRRAKKNEEIVTLDGEKRILDERALIIASTGNWQLATGNPVAIAGIMGGKESEVNFNTKNVLLEAAIFNPIIIRRSRQAVGLNSESSYRFERGMPTEVAIQASMRAVELISELAGGKLTLAKAQGKISAKPKTITLNNEQVNKILGVNVKPALIKSGLSALGFKVKAKTKNNFVVTVPPFRPDVGLKEDVIEEIARIFGYDKIPVTLPAIKPQITGYSPRDFIATIKNTLVSLGLSEVVTYSMVDKILFKDFNLNAQAETVEILNPLSCDQGILRPTLIPSLASRIAFNLNHKQENINIFEVADIYRWQENKEEPVETPVLGLALQESNGFLHAKGVISALFEKLKLPAAKFSEDAENPSQINISVKNESAGRVVILSKQLLEKLDIKNQQVCAAEIYLEKLLPLAPGKNKFKGLPVYPAISRDISILLKQDASLDEVLDGIRDRAGLILESVKIADFYKGKQIPDGFIGVTISCVYRSPERTLLESEVVPLHEKIVQFLTQKFAAKLR